MSTFEHVTVLLEKSIEALAIKEDGIYVDCTLGGAGHSSLILKHLKKGHLFAFDQDMDAVVASQIRLSEISNQFTIINQNFKYIKSALSDQAITQVDGVLYDLGVSSHQFDTPERGFSYRFDARLDMRMDQSQTLSAYEVVNTYDFHQIKNLLLANADEKFAVQIARAIEREREIKPIETTFELVEVIKKALPAKAKSKKGHPAKKTFQAIRIEVNKEFEVLEQSLKDALDLVKVGGRVVVITFHSTEDRICKHIFNEVTKVKSEFRKFPVIPEPYLPKFKNINVGYHVDEKEIEENHRSHSARIRVIERVRA